MERNKRIGIQVILTMAILFLAFFITSIVNDTDAGALERGHAGVAQISDNPNTVVASHYIQTHNIVSEAAWCFAFILIVLVWIVPFVNGYYRKKNKKCGIKRGYRL